MTNTNKLIEIAKACGAKLDSSGAFVTKEKASIIFKDVAQFQATIDAVNAQANNADSIESTNSALPVANASQDKPIYQCSWEGSPWIDIAKSEYNERPNYEYRTVYLKPQTTKGE